MSNINDIVADYLHEAIMAPPGQKGILGKTASAIGQVGHGVLNPVTTASNIGSRIGQLPGIRHVGMATNAVLNPISSTKAGLSRAGSFLSRF